MNIKKRYIVIIFLFGFCSFLKAQYLKTDKYEEQKTSIIVKFKKENILNRDVLNRVLRSPGTHTLSVANTGSLQGTTFDAVLKDTVDATYNHIKLFQDPSGLTTQSVGSNYYIVDIASGDAEKVLKIFNQDASIEYAEVNQIISLPKDVNHPDGFSKTGFSSSNFEVQSSDPGFSNQYYYSGLNIPVVMEYTGQDEILVAIVDSGIDIYHEDLDGKIAINGNEVLNGIDDDFNGVIDDIYGYNFSGYFEGGGSNSITDGFGHGTHISGIIASKVGNGVGIKGINPNVKLLAVPFLNRFGFGTQVDAARAIQYAVDRGAKIINCSWGYTSDSALMRESFEYAFERGVIVIAAVGNGSSTKLEYPAAYDESIGVGSTNLDGNRSSFSNYGEQLDFLTYGEKIYSLLPNNRYAYKSGSSQSTAIVTGLVSGLLSKYPDLLQEEVIEILKYSSVNPENSSKTAGYGYGVLSPNLLAATFKAYAAEHPLSSGEGDDDSLIVSLIANFPNPVRNDGTTFGFQSSGEGDVKIDIYDIFGNQLSSLSSNVIDGYNTIYWEGTSSSGTALSNGTYFYLVTVSSSTGQTIGKDKLSIVR